MEFTDTLLQWYDRNKRTLPWRGAGDAYAVLVSEIMLQQTRAAAVIPYYGRFMAALPTVEALAECPEERLLKLWEGLGYYSRARNLKKCAQAVVAEHGGRFPQTVEELKKLPGVGPYTAGAIASIAFGEPESAVDGNVVRLLTRLEGCADPADEKLKSLTESNIYMVLDKNVFGSFADQLWKSFADLMGPVKWFGVIMFVLMVYLLAKQIIERNAVSISMAKILGFSSGEIGGLYIVSTTIVVVLSLLLAVPAVDWLLRLIFKYYLYQRMSGYLPYCISNDCYVKMVLLGIVSYAAVAVLQLLKIRKIRKSDALKNME